ncbi:MAG TPA: hypothetical protein VHD32_01300 [Candidatus Didemnitutus sp.]|nr:hypothetical protein [Candidatus Didemnitutus sp.]
MSPAVASFMSSLRSYDPSEDALPITKLYPMVGPIEKEESAVEAFGEIFAFFERHPEADLGSPGPLVHLIESHVGKYEDLLAASLKRKPSVTTVTMAHRILNAHRSSKERNELMALLADVSGNPDSSDYVREQARHYHECQTRG